MRPALIALALAASLVLVAGCGGSGSDEAAPATAPGAPSVEELASLDALAEAFDADAGKPRLLLILSPT